MSRVCQITGKKTISGNNVAHSNKRTKRKYYPNLFEKKFYIPEENRWIKIRVSAAGMRLIDKVGISEALRRAKEKGYIQNY